MIERCLWSDQAPLPRRPVASLPRSTDVAIIGGGYTGLAAARTLARGGADVTLLERYHLGWGASSRNAGFVLPGFKLPVEALARRMGRDRTRAMFRLSLDAVGYLERLLAEEEISCDFVRCGAATLAAKPSHLRALERGGRFLRDVLGYETDLLGPRDVGRIVGSTRYHGGLLDPFAASLQPARYVRGLSSAAERAGARLLEDTEVVSLKRGAGRFELGTSRGFVRAGEVLAATNGYTPTALARLRRRVVPIGSHMIATAPLEEELARRLIPQRRLLSDTRHLLYYFRLSPDGRMIFGGRASFTPASTRRSAAILAAGMREVFPALAGIPIEYAWSGKVACSLDHLPHAGQLDGVHYAMGYCGHGIAMATYLGTLMGQVLAGAAQMPDLGRERFRAIPLFNGFPWFLPLVGAYYRARDWLS